jgi:hypothetical protein
MAKKKNQNRHSRTKIEDKDINPFKSWLILTKEPKTNVEEKTASSTNCAGKTGYRHVKDWN